MEKELTSMEKVQAELQGHMRAGETPARPTGSGLATIVCQEKLIPQEKLVEVPGVTKDVSGVKADRLTLTVQVVDVPPGGRVPEHHHGGPTIDYVLSGAIRMQLLGGPTLVYKSGQTMSEPAGSVHLCAENLSLTEPARIMLIHVHDGAAQLVVFH
jgi:quercetin dioxygenase-like cupin family protein